MPLVPASQAVDDFQSFMEFAGELCENGDLAKNAGHARGSPWNDTPGAADIAVERCQRRF
eukprot:1063220-Pyramimonas_sp.AAC.1